MKDLIGKSVWIEIPVKPEHYQGYAVITNVTKTGKLKYEIEQIRSKQWYSADQFFPHESMKIITQEDIYQKHYEDKKAWMESLEKEEENLDSEAWNQYEGKKLCDQYKEAISEATEDIKGCSTFANGSSNQTSTAVPFIGGTTTGGPFSILGRPYIPETSANYTKEQSALIKKALALLAEQKQNEIKEIEELIKKL